MISYIEGHEVTPVELKKALRRATLAGTITPVLCGSALRNKGVQLMLDAVIDYLPSPEDVPPVTGTDPKTGEPVERASRRTTSRSARWRSRSSADPYVGRLAYFRVYSGTRQAGRRDPEHDAGRARSASGGCCGCTPTSARTSTEVYAGDIVRGGRPQEHVHGRHALRPERTPIHARSDQVPRAGHLAWRSSRRRRTTRTGWARRWASWSEEDPTFRTRFDEETGQTIISGMGELHLEVIVDRMLREFRVDANVGRPAGGLPRGDHAAVKAEGRFVRQTVAAASTVSSSSRSSRASAAPASCSRTRRSAAPMPKEYIGPTEARASREALESGPVGGYPVVDVTVALVDGSYHPVDSSEMAFRMAGIEGMRKAMAQRGRRDAGADHEGRRSRRRSSSSATSLGDVNCAARPGHWTSRRAASCRSSARSFRWRKRSATRPALRSLTQGRAHLHDGVRPLRAECPRTSRESSGGQGPQRR